MALKTFAKALKTFAKAIEFRDDLTNERQYFLEVLLQFRRNAVG